MDAVVYLHQIIYFWTSWKLVSALVQDIMRNALDFILDIGATDVA